MLPRSPASPAPGRISPRIRYSLPRRIVIALRNAYIDGLRAFYVHALGMDLAPNCRFSLKANLDWTHPRGVHVGEHTYIAFHATILAHDMSRNLHADTRVGSCCFVGAYAIIMPGVTVGDHCIIGSGAVVTKDVPSGCIVAGNPARIIREGIRTSAWGILQQAPPPN